MFIRSLDSRHGRNSYICSRESTNLHDPFTVKVLKSKTIVGHQFDLQPFFLEKEDQYHRQRTMGIR